MFRRNDRANSILVTSELVFRLVVVTRIGCHQRKPHSLKRIHYQRMKVWKSFQFHGFAQRGMVGQMSNYASAVGLREILQHQAGKKLMLIFSEDFVTITVRVIRILI